MPEAEKRPSAMLRGVCNGYEVTIRFTGENPDTLKKVKSLLVGAYAARKAALAEK